METWIPVFYQTMEIRNERAAAFEVLGLLQDGQQQRLQACALYECVGVTASLLQLHSFNR